MVYTLLPEQSLWVTYIHKKFTIQFLLMAASPASSYFIHSSTVSRQVTDCLEQGLAGDFLELPKAIIRLANYTKFYLKINGCTCTPPLYRMLSELLWLMSWSRCGYILFSTCLQKLVILLYYIQLKRNPYIWYFFLQSKYFPTRSEISRNMRKISSQLCFWVRQVEYIHM